MKTYAIELTGVTPLMTHRDNLEFKALVDKWQRDPSNRDKSIPGDDRSPAWNWIGSVYENGAVIVLPSECLMASCKGAGTELKAARGKKSLKAQTQSGMSFLEPFLEFRCDGGRTVAMDDLRPLHQEEDFARHLTHVRALGFALDIRRVKVGMSKHIRVRPVFETWRATGSLSVWDDVLTKDTLATLFFLAGDKYGVCEWRPGGRQPGPFGRFRATVNEA